MYQCHCLFVDRSDSQSLVGVNSNAPLPNLGELANLYSSIRHVGDDLELSAHCFNDFAQGADVHVRASWCFKSN